MSENRIFTYENLGKWIGNLDYLLDKNAIKWYGDTSTLKISNILLLNNEKEPNTIIHLNQHILKDIKTIIIHSRKDTYINLYEDHPHIPNIQFELTGNVYLDIKYNIQEDELRYILSRISHLTSIHIFGQVTIPLLPVFEYGGVRINTMNSTPFNNFHDAAQILNSYAYKQNQRLLTTRFISDLWKAGLEDYL